MAKKGHFLLGFVIGSVAACTAAILLAPSAGEELLESATKKLNKMKNRAIDYHDYASEASEDFRYNTKDKLSNVAEKAQDFGAQFKTAIQNNTPQKADFDAATDALKSQLKKAKEDINQDTDVNDSDFDDIVIDGQSAFGEAKDDLNVDEDATSEVEKEHSKK